MVSVLASTVVDREFQPRSSQSKDCKIGMCCFSAKIEESHINWFNIICVSVLVSE